MLYLGVNIAEKKFLQGSHFTSAPEKGFNYKTVKNQLNEDKALKYNILSVYLVRLGKSAKLAHSHDF
jgi:hypothetical protein